MVLPDGTKSDQNRPGRSRALLFAVAALAIVAGFVALGSLSPSEQLAVDTTTTTTTIPEVEAPIDLENFSVSQIATGPPLEWERVAGSTTGYPLAVTEHEGVLYLFTSEAAPWADEPGGLVTWRSSDGTDWEPVGETVISGEFHVANVIASADGFVAIGTESGNGTLFVWRSDDGIEWASTEIPTGAESPYLTPTPTAAAVFRDRLVIAAGHRLDQRAVVTDSLAEAGIDVDLPMMSWSTQYGGEDGVQLTVSGPLGIPVLTTTLEELGLTEQEHQWVMSGLDRGEQTEIWLVNDSGSVETSTIPLFHVDTVVAQPDGTLFASGFGGAGLNDAFVSADGLNWEEVDDGNIARAIPWGDRLIGIADGPGVGVLMSSDGRTWEESDVMDRFPSQWGWYPVAMGAGPDGLAMILEGQDSTTPPPRVHTDTTLTSDGATLSVDPQGSVYVLEIEGERHIWNMYQPGSAQVPEELEVDLANKAVLFQDPETGETLAQFSFEELQRLESGSRLIRFSDVIGHHALAFTEDGSDWEIRDLEPVVGDDSRVVLLEVASGRLVAVAHEPILGPQQPLPTGFEIWSAPLP